VERGFLIPCNQQDNPIEEEEEREKEVEREEKTLSKGKSEDQMALPEKLAKEIQARTGRTVKVWPSSAGAFARLKQSTDGGEKAVMSAFRDWLDANPDHTDPVAGFVGEAPEFMSGAKAAVQIVRGQVKGDPRVVELAAKVFDLTGTAPAAKSLLAIGELLVDHDMPAILAAFGEFYGNLDEFGQKQAVRNFFEGGAAPAVLASQKSYLETRQRNEKLLDHAVAESSKKVEQEIALVSGVEIVSSGGAVSGTNSR